MKIKAQTSIILLFALIMPLSSLARQTVPETFFRFLNGNFYELNRPLIDAGQALRGALRSVYYRIFCNKNNLNTHIKAIERRLKKIEAILHNRERQALGAIKKRFKIADAVWKECLATIDELKKGNQNALKQSWAGTHHDQTVSSELLDILRTILHKNNINPKSISIKNGIKNDADNDTIAVSRSAVQYTDTSKSHIAQKYIPQAIEFFSDLKDSTAYKKIAICAHEIEHLLQQHTITTLIIKHFITHHGYASEKQVKKDKIYKRFCKLQESQAEIFPSLRDPEIAHCMRQFRAQKYYPNNLYEDHYYYLSLIDTLWKLHAQLSQK